MEVSIKREAQTKDLKETFPSYKPPEISMITGLTGKPKPRLSVKHHEYLYQTEKEF